MRLRPLAGLSLILVTGSLGAEVIERVIAKVNGEIVTLSEFEARQLAALQANRIGPDQVENYLRQNNGRILQEATDELLLVQRARELDIKVRPEYVTEVVDGIKKENHIESDQALQEQLRKEGLSLDGLKRNIEHSILRQEVVKKEVQSKAVITDADALVDYNAHIEQYRHPATMHLQEILVKAEDKELAAQLVSRARKGEDFSAMAKTHSIAPTRASGGDLGNVAKGELNPDIEKVALSLSAGGVSEPMPTEGGLRILRVAESTPEKVVPFDSVKADLLKQLSQDRLNQEYEKYIDGLRKSASIDLKVKDVPVDLAAPALGPDLSPPGTGNLAGAPAASPADPNAEFNVTPQSAPERIAPGAAAQPKPAPSPSPH